jgi:hypothetical protein
VQVALEPIATRRIHHSAECRTEDLVNLRKLTHIICGSSWRNYAVAMRDRRGAARRGFEAEPPNWTSLNFKEELPLLIADIFIVVARP